MDSILRRFGSLPEERKHDIVAIENSIVLSSDCLMNFGKDSVAALTNTLDIAAAVLNTEVSCDDVESLIEETQKAINNLTKIIIDLENHVFAAEFFLRNKKTPEVFVEYHNLSLSEKIKFRNTQMLMDLLEEKSVSLLKFSVLAVQCKMQLIINNDIVKNT